MREITANYADNRIVKCRPKDTRNKKPKWYPKRPEFHTIPGKVKGVVVNNIPLFTEIAEIGLTKMNFIYNIFVTKSLSANYR